MGCCLDLIGPYLNRLYFQNVKEGHNEARQMPVATWKRTLKMLHIQYQVTFND